MIFQAWRTMGFQMEDDNRSRWGVVDHNGFFIYRDRSTLESYEDVLNLWMIYR